MNSASEAEYELRYNATHAGSCFESEEAFHTALQDAGYVQWKDAGQSWIEYSANLPYEASTNQDVFDAYLAGCRKTNPPVNSSIQIVNRLELFIQQLDEARSTRTIYTYADVKNLLIRLIEETQ